MDEADIAQRNQEQFDRLALQRQLARMPQGEAATECEDCEHPIPEQRQQAAPGCTRCIHCQQKFERQLKGYR